MFESGIISGRQGNPTTVVLSIAAAVRSTRNNKEKGIIMSSRCSCEEPNDKIIGMMRCAMGSMIL